jgi:hypothetical protein
MGKGGRSYVAMQKNNSMYKLYMDDVKTWRQVIKKRTPRLPTYNDETQSNKWEEAT